MNNLIIICDAGRDLDDEQAILLLVTLMRLGLVKIKAVVANLYPAKERARLVKGMLERLGYPDIPVGIGTDCGLNGSVFEPYETAVPYLADPDRLENGLALVVRTLEQADSQSIHLLLVSGMTDAAELLRLHTDLFVDRVASVTLMSGVRQASGTTPLLDQMGFLMPDKAHNNTFDPTATKYLYYRLQQLGVPMVVLIRATAYAAQFPVSLYQQLAATGHPVGLSLYERQRHSFQQLWRTCHAAPGSTERDTLPERCDRAWFVRTFCAEADPGIDSEGEVWPFVRHYQQYDALAALAASSSELLYRFFDSTPVSVGDVAHRIIHLDPRAHGVRDKPGLLQFVSEAQVRAPQKSVD